jgi:hypothetical protein
VNNSPVVISDASGLAGEPGIGDQINPYGVRGYGRRDYTGYFNQRFPKTIAGASALLTQRLIAKVCSNWSSTLVPALTGTQEDVDISPDMRRALETSPKALTSGQ